MHRAQMECIDMARLRARAILKEMRILTMRLVGGAGLTYRNGRGAAQESRKREREREIPICIETRVPFSFLTIPQR